MLSQRKLKRLIYPTELVDREVARLQRDLRRLYRRYRRQELNHLHCYVDGEALIRASFAKAESNVKVFLFKHGVVYDGDHSEIDATLRSTLESWRRLVDAF